MKKILIFSVLLASTIHVNAQRFDDYFEDRTLRLDYTFAGNHEHQELYVDELVSLPHWYGRRQRLDEVPLKGNGEITVRSKADGKVIYRHTFSSLFQEWLSTEESKRTMKSFENVFLVPFPKAAVDITVTLRDYHEQVNATMTHSVDPKDILIRKTGEELATPYITLQKAADTTRCIHVAYVAEGYQQHEMGTFLEDCKIAMESLFAHEPFKQMQDRFNMVAVMSPSAESGTSWPAKGIWKNTVLGSHFDTFYSDRYLTTLHLKKLHDVLAGIPYEHIIILVNTDHYGGGGIYNSTGCTVTVQIKDPSLRVISRQVSLPSPTASTDRIYRTACELVREHWEESHPIRLLCVQADRLIPEDKEQPVQLSMLDTPTSSFVHCCALLRMRDL